MATVRVSPLNHRERERRARLVLAHKGLQSQALTKLLFVAKLLRDKPYPIIIAEHNQKMMERNKVKMEAMKRAIQHMRENMPS